MKEDLIHVRNLVKLFPLDKMSAIYAVNDVSFSIKKSEALGLVGESGSGKTTVGRCVLNLIHPTSGEIEFQDRDLLTVSEVDLRKMRSMMSIVFQDPYTSLNPMRTVILLKQANFAVTCFSG